MVPKHSSYNLHRIAAQAWILVLIWIWAVRRHFLPFHWTSSSFTAIGGIGLVGNILWWSYVDRMLQPPPPRTLANRVLRVLWALYILVMWLGLVALMTRSDWCRTWPYAVNVLIMSWNLLLPCFVVPASIWMLNHVCVSMLGMLRHLRRAERLQDSQLHSREKRSETGSAHPSEDDSPPVPQLARRSLVFGIAALPLAATAAAVIGSKRQEGRFLVRRIALKMPRLPDRLRGLTITHVSDIHTGRLFRPEHLPRVVDAVNKLKSDLVAVTGDIIDDSIDYLPATCDAISQFEHQYGRFLILGNHDLIDKPREFIEYVSGRESKFLIDRFVRSDIGGESIQVLGMGWPIPDRDDANVAVASRASTTTQDSNPDVFTLGLVHHPHDFDDLIPYGVDLTLAGHTHGGQIMLTPPGAPLRLGLGSLKFHYIHGEYSRGRSCLYVNSGVGNWFPVRFNAPAEIVQIRLI